MAPAHRRRRVGVVTGLLAAVGPVVAGSGLGLVPAARRGLAPIRTFALVSALAVVFGAMLPHATAELGALALIVFGLALLVPSAVERFGGRHLGGDLGFAGLLAHQLVEGGQLGAIHQLDDGTFGPLALAIGAHTAPFAAVVVLAHADRSDFRGAAIRAGALTLATAAGFLLASAVDPATLHGVDSWLGAVVGGLMLHILAHDIQAERPATSAARAAELFAVGAGIAVPLWWLGAGAFAHGAVQDDHGGFVDTSVMLLLEISPALLIGILLTAIGRTLRRGAARSGVLGLRRSGAAAPAVAGLLVASPLVSGEAMLVLGALLGVGAAAVYAAVSLLAPVVAALAVARLSTGLYRSPGPSPESPRLAASVPRELVGHYDEVARTVAPWIGLGICIAAYIEATVPTGALGMTGAATWQLGVLCLLLVVVHVHAVAAAIVGSVLVHKGMPITAVVAVVVLSAGLGTRAVVVLERAYGRRAAIGAVLAVLAVVVLAWSMGTGLGTTLPTDIFDDNYEHGPVHAALSVLVLALLTRSLWQVGVRGWVAAVVEPSMAPASTSSQDQV